MKSKKIKIEIEPIGKRILLSKPTNGLKAIADAGIDIKSVCGGKGTCGKCRIVIPNGKNNLPNEQEQKTLSPDEIKHGVRLACQQTFDKDMAIYIPASSLSEEQKLQVSGVEKKIRVCPVCKKYHLKLKKAALDDMKADFSRTRESLKEEYSVNVDSIDYEVLKKLPSVIRDNSWEITVTVRAKEIILVEGGDKKEKACGIAVDLGTTKIAVLLVDLITGKTIDMKGIMNPQISYGEDVMSRINFAMQSQDNTDEIKKVVENSINKTIEQLCRRNDLKTEEIIEMTIVGNTAMHHLFLGLPVRQLGLSPFLPLTDEALDIKAREAGIDISPGAYIYMLPPVAGFVGSDHVAMILATDLYEMDGNCIGIDIGTNTEIALKSGDSMASVSTASGPAFEGAHIEHGMRAAPGAIERVAIDPKTRIPSIQTIGDREPVGICGSGILDSIAELLKAGIIDRRGKFILENDFVHKGSTGISQYILNPSFYKTKGNEKKNEASINSKSSGCDENKHSKYGSKDISINQKDIVEIQLAKSAIKTGIDILLENAGIGFREIDRIVIAGAFGSYIDPKNVINIGMFPEIHLNKIIQVGNAAGVGAKMVLISAEKRKIAEKIAHKTKYLELTVSRNFSSYFADNIQFPEPAEII